MEYYENGCLASAALRCERTGGGGCSCPRAPLTMPADRWKLEIFGNANLTEPSVEQRYDAAGSAGFDFDCGSQGPSACAGGDHFGIRFTTQLPDRGEANPGGRTTSIIGPWIRTERRFKASGSSRHGPPRGRQTTCSISRRAAAWTISGEYFQCPEDGVPSIPRGAGVPSAPTWETLRATRSGAWECRAIDT